MSYLPSIFYGALIECIRSIVPPCWKTINYIESISHNIDHISLLYKRYSRIYKIIRVLWKILVEVHHHHRALHFWGGCTASSLARERERERVREMERFITQ